MPPGTAASISASSEAKPSVVEHRLDVLGAQPDVPVDEGQRAVELGERGVV